MSRKYVYRPKSERGTGYYKRRENVGDVIYKRMWGGVAKITITAIIGSMLRYKIEGIKVCSPTEEREWGHAKFRAFINKYADATPAQRWGAGY